MFGSILKTKLAFKHLRQSLWEVGAPISPSTIFLQNSTSPIILAEIAEKYEL